MRLQAAVIGVFGVLSLAPFATANVCVYKPPRVRYVAGVVVDSQGRPIPGADVVILRDQTQVDEQRSNQLGTFVFGSLKQGTYQIEVKANGFASGHYSLTLYRPSTSYNRYLEIELAVGGEPCYGDIKVIENGKRYKD